MPTPSQIPFHPRSSFMVENGALVTALRLVSHLKEGSEGSQGSAVNTVCQSLESGSIEPNDVAKVLEAVAG